MAVDKLNIDLAKARARKRLASCPYMGWSTYLAGAIGAINKEEVRLAVNELAREGHIVLIKGNGGAIRLVNAEYAKGIEAEVLDSIPAE